jgi:hypothetical protein
MRVNTVHGGHPRCAAATAAAGDEDDQEHEREGAAALDTPPGINENDNSA